MLDTPEVDLVTFADDAAYWLADADARTRRIPAVLHRVAAAHAAWAARDDGVSVAISVESGRENMNNQVTVRETDDIILINGREWGWVAQGANGRFYGLPLATLSHSWPLQGLDNVKTTGSATKQEAAESWAAFVQQQAH